MSTPARRADPGARSGVPERRAAVGLVSLGCAKNHVDSEIMLGVLDRQGYRLVADLDEAETVIVNTCGFIDEAREESIDAILDAAARKSDGGAPVRQVLVAGCMANRYGQELQAEIPEIDGFVDLDSLRQVGSLVKLGGAPAAEALRVPPGLRSPGQPVAHHERLRVPQGRGRVQQPVHLLRHSRVAGPVAESHNGQPGRGGERSGGARGPRTRARGPGHDPVRGRSGLRPARSGASRGGVARGHGRGVDPGSSTPIRPRSTTPCSS